MRRRQGHGVIGEGLVHGRTADLDHLEPGRGFEHAVADLRRLQHAIAGVEQERLALVLVDQPRPAGLAIDHLEADAVEMHVVRHRPAVGDADVRGDEAPAQAARDQIAILHAGAPDAPMLAHTAQHEFLACPAGTSTGSRASTSSMRVPSGAVSTCGVPAGRAARSHSRRNVIGVAVAVRGFEPQRQAMTRNHGDARRVRRKDQVDLEAQTIGEKSQRRREVAARQQHLRHAHMLGQGRAGGVAVCGLPWPEIAPAILARQGIDDIPVTSPLRPNSDTIAGSHRVHIVCQQRSNGT